MTNIPLSFSNAKFQVKRDMVAIKHELDTVQQVKEEIEELREYVDRLEEHTQRRKLRLLEQVNKFLLFFFSSSLLFFDIYILYMTLCIFLGYLRTYIKYAKKKKEKKAKYCCFHVYIHPFFVLLVGCMLMSHYLWNMTGERNFTFFLSLLIFFCIFSFIKY